MEIDMSEDDISSYYENVHITTDQKIGYSFAIILVSIAAIFLAIVSCNENKIEKQAMARTCQEQEFSETEECIQFRSAQKYQAFNDRIQYYRKLR